MSTAYKKKPFIKKLVFKFCAGGLPDQLLCEYLDNLQFALVEAFEFAEEFDLQIEPDHSRAAFTPDWKNPSTAYPTVRPFEMKAYRTQASQDLELTALAARVVVPGYLELLSQQKRVENWLPGWSLEDDKLMLKWVSQCDETPNVLAVRWVSEQVAAYLSGVDLKGYRLRELAGLVLSRWERFEAKMTPA